MNLSSLKDTIIGIVGPVDINLIDKQKEWPDMPSGNEYPMFSYYVNYLIENNIKVIVYTTSPRIKKISKYIDDRVSIYVAPQRNGKFFKNYFLETKDIKGMIRTAPADILFAQWTYEFALAALLPGRRTIITINDNACRIFLIKPSINKLIKLLLNRLVLNKSTQLVAVSQYIYNNLYLKEKRKAVVIPNFYPRYLENQFTDYKNRKKIIVTFCNGFGRRTNVKRAIEAFKIFCGKHKNNEFTYHLIGSDVL